MNNFYEIRSFAEVISTTSTFMSSHWKMLMRLLSITALPFIMIGFMISSRTFAWFMFYISSRDKKTELDNSAFFYDGVRTPSMFNFNDYFLPTIALLILGALLLVAVVISLVKWLHDHPESKQWQARAILKYSIDRFPRFLGSLFIMGLIISIFLALFFFSFKLEGEVYPLIIALLCGIVLYFGIPIYLYLPATFNEKTNILKTLSRCFYLTNGYWWSTFGLLFISFLMLSFLAYPLLIASSIPYEVFKDLTLIRIEAIFDLILLLVRTFVFLFSGIFLTLVGTFQYYNLVAIKDGVGLLEKIEQIGAT